MERTLLGLACGQPDGSAEILLKAALQAAEAAGAGWNSCGSIPPSARRRPSRRRLVVLGEARRVRRAGSSARRSSPAPSPARLKLLGDRLLGPNADAAIIEELARGAAAGGEPTVPFRVDERVLKPRVAGFLAVGGSLTPQWKTLTLPVMHTMTFSMPIAVVDQVAVRGGRDTRSIVLDDSARPRGRARCTSPSSWAGASGRRVPRRPGLCPLCHLTWSRCAAPRRRVRHLRRPRRLTATACASRTSARSSP